MLTVSGTKSVQTLPKIIQKNLPITMFRNFQYDIYKMTKTTLFIH